MGGSSDAAIGVECNSRWRAWSSRSGVESSRNPRSKSERLVRAYSARRVFRARQVLLPAIWIGKRAFLCQRRSKALPLLILGFIKIRKGRAAGMLGFWIFPLFMQLKVSDWRVSKKGAAPPLNSNPSSPSPPFLPSLLLIRSSFHRAARIRCT